MKKEAILLDSFAVLAYLQDEPAAERIEELFKRNHNLYMSSINLGEVYYILLRKRDRQKAQEDLQSILDSDIEIIETDWLLVKKAAEIKSKGNISYADCFAVAAASQVKARIITGDPEFKIAEKEKLAQIEWLV